MHYCLAILMLFAASPAMRLLAAPIPAPSAILQIEPPPKGESMENHLEYIIGQNLTCPYSMPFTVWLDPEIRKLPTVAAKKDAIQGRSWIAMNIRVTKEDGGRRLRLTFRPGDRREQVAILSSFRFGLWDNDNRKAPPDNDLCQQEHSRSEPCDTRSIHSPPPTSRPTSLSVCKNTSA